MTKFMQFVRDDSGATAIEYGLIAALISVVIIAAVTLAHGSLLKAVAMIVLVRAVVDVALGVPVGLLLQPALHVGRLRHRVVQPGIEQRRRRAVHQIGGSVVAVDVKLELRRILAYVAHEQLLGQRDDASLHIKALGDARHQRIIGSDHQGAGHPTGHSVLHAHRYLVAVALRGAFALQASFMLINNAVFFTMWLIFFNRFEEVGGWKLEDVGIVFGVVALAFGLAHVLGAGATQLARMIVPSPFRRGHRRGRRGKHGLELRRHHSRVARSKEGALPAGDFAQHRQVAGEEGLPQ